MSARRWALAVGGGLLGVAVVLILILSGGDSTRVVPFTNVTAAYPNLEYPKRALYVFRDRKLLDEHLSERTGRSGNQLARIKRPRIDFNKEMLIVVAIGARSSTGYGIEPVAVERSGGDTDVKVREISPKVGRVVAPVLTYPYLVLVVPKAAGRTRLRFAGN